MSISKNIKKLLVAGAAIIMVASAGANLNNVNAKRRGRYHCRTHRVYRKRAKRGYKRAHRSYRHARKHTYRRKRARRHAYKRRATHKATGLNSYIYHLTRRNVPELKQLSSNCGLANNSTGHTSISSLFKKYSRNGKDINVVNMNGFFTTLPDAKNILRDNGTSFNEAVKEGSISKGPVRYMMFNDQQGFYTQRQIKADAHMNHMSVSAFLHKYQKQPSKWWHNDGSSTKLALQVGERDAINDLNKERESQGAQPVIQDPTLEFIANKRVQLMGSSLNPGPQAPTYSWHTDKNGNSFDDDIADKYNIPQSKRPVSENAATVDIGNDYDTPSKLGQEENDTWGPEHKAIRDQPGNQYAGIGISNNGNIVEEFR